MKTNFKIKKVIDANIPYWYFTWNEFYNGRKEFHYSNNYKTEKRAKLEMLKSSPFRS